MLTNDEHWLSIADEFQAAGVRGTGWYQALENLAKATGSQHGQLIRIGDDATVPIDILTDMDPTFHDEFVAMGGGDPRINPRVRAGMSSPVLKVLAERCAPARRRKPSPPPARWRSARCARRSKPCWPRLAPRDKSSWSPGSIQL